MADWHHDQDFGFWGAVLGGMIATYFTFIPCFFWIFQGGPSWSRFRGNHFLSGALTAITAAVVGVILNLAVWFGLNVLFPAAQGIDWFDLEVAAISFLAMQRFKLYIIPVVTRHRRPRSDLPACYFDRRAKSKNGLPPWIIPELKLELGPSQPRDPGGA